MRYAFVLIALLVTSQLVAQQATQTSPAAQDQQIRTDQTTQPNTQEIRRDSTLDARPGVAGTDRDRAARGHDKVLRASELTGMDVRNRANEDLGEIHDLVINPSDGRIAYAAVSMGGFLGVGDKLFAVPFDAIQIREVEGEHVAHLDVNKQTMENAQGFDQENWPDMASPQWRDENDRRYHGLRPQRHEVLRPNQPSTSPGVHQPGQPGTQSPRLNQPNQPQPQNSGTQQPGTQSSTQPSTQSQQ